MAIQARKTDDSIVTLSYDQVYVRVAGEVRKPAAVYARRSGTIYEVWRSNGPPPSPSNLTRTAANGGTITVNWTWAANAEGDYNRVEVQNPDNTARYSTNYSGTSQLRTGYSHGQSVPLQARTVDNAGLVSPWVDLSAVTTINQAPSAATGLGANWNGSNWNVTWTNPANPYGDSMTVQIHRYTNQWDLMHTRAWSGGAQSQLVAANGWDTAHAFLVRVIGPAGQADTSVYWNWTPPASGTEKFIGATDGDTFAYTLNGWRNDGSVRAGRYDGYPMGVNYGLWFYGTQLWDACHGYVPTTAQILLVRDGTQGFSGNVRMVTHGYTEQPAGQPVQGPSAWTSASTFLGSDATSWETIPAGAKTELAVGSSKGIGIYQTSTAQSEYRHFRGPATNGMAGMIKLVF